MNMNRKTLKAQLRRGFVRSILLNFLLIGSLFLTTSPAISTPAAGPWYVAPGGDDANDCLAPAAPCATINAAIGKASPGDTVYVAEGIYTGEGDQVVSIDKSITLLGGWDEGFNTQARASTIDSEELRRGIMVGTGITATIEAFIIENGHSSYGGGISNQGTLTMTLVTVKDNQADGYGGGLHNSSNLVMRESMVQGNQNGGIFNVGTLSMYNSAVIENTIGDRGGGISNFDISSVLNINNSTISRNSAGDIGGGIFNDGLASLSINSSTVSGNIGNQGGGGIYGDAELRNSILAGNTASGGSSADCSGDISSAGYNLVENTNGCTITPASGDLLGENAALSPFSGPAGVQPLFRHSPAIDAGNPAGCTDHEGNPLDTDQRGVARVGRCDIGAYEYDPALDPLHYLSLPVTLHNYSPCPNFFDDFSDPASGWFTGEDSTGQIEYLNGEYSVLVKPTSYYWVLGAPTCDRVNYTVEVEARWAGNSGASYGLVFGIQGDFEQFYSFEVNSDYQEYSLYRYGPSGWIELAAITYSPAILPESQTNHLKVTRSGDAITLEVNGTILGTWVDSAITGASNSGLIVSSYSNLEDAEARFDNFKMAGLGGALNSSPASASLNSETNAAQEVLNRRVYRQGIWR